MTIQVTMTFDNPSDVVLFFAKRNSEVTEPTFNAKVNAKHAIKEAEAEIKENKAEEKALLRAEQEADVSEVKVISFDDVKNAVLNVSKLKGRDAAVAVLAKFGAEKVGPQLKVKDYAAIVDECERVVAA